MTIGFYILSVRSVLSTCVITAEKKNVSKVGVTRNEGMKEIEQRNKVG
jgi:hypothetical protein